jgi:hypothetical protein
MIPERAKFINNWGGERTLGKLEDVIKVRRGAKFEKPARYINDKISI